MTNDSERAGTPAVAVQRFVSQPHRVQLSRKKGCKLPANTAVVSRPSKWGNPYKLGGFVPGIGTLKNMTDVVEAYRQNIEARLAEETPSGAMLRLDMEINLRGKNLACWCALDAPCHADVLLRLANEKSSRTPDL
jgi:hypothetical protein